MWDFFRNLSLIFLFGGLFFGNALIVNSQTPVRFIENKNQWADDVHYMSRVPGGKMAVGPAMFKYFFLDNNKLESLHHHSHEAEPDGLSEADSHVRGHSVFVNFPGADPTVKPQGFGRSLEYYNYFIGNDRSRW